METDWKARLGSRRTLGRLIRFELLLMLVFGVASIALLFIPQDDPSAGGAPAVTAVTLARSDTQFVYPFPVYREITISRQSLYRFATVRREEADLLTLEEEPEVVEQVADEVKEEDAPPLPDLFGLVLVGTLTGVDGESIAIVRDDSMGETVYVKAGDELNGATVQSIANNVVRVVLGEEEDELRGMSYLFEGSEDGN
ncbi:MAG: hypothetical protein QF485_05445 [Arenicellales bacterium]|jgi:hypothetical protein|nr:hypothetical protein [Arenicellales bacterium]